MRLKASVLGTESKVSPSQLPAFWSGAHAHRSSCRFISAIHIPRDPAAHNVLISGGGDPVIKVWQWRTGRLLYDVVIEEIVRPFIAVCRAQRKRGYDSDGERKPPSRRWLARQLSEDDVNTVAEAEVEVDAEDVDVDDDEGNESGDETVDVPGDPEDPP